MNFEPLFAKIEKAIDDHPLLQRNAKVPILSAPWFTVNRDGWTIMIAVGLKGSRKKHTRIHGYGETAEESVDKLIESLDHWAEAMR